MKESTRLLRAKNTAEANRKRLAKGHWVNMFIGKCSVSGIYAAFSDSIICE